MTIIWKEIKDENSLVLEEIFKFYDNAFPIEVREPHDIFYKSIQYGRQNNLNNFRCLVGFEGKTIVSFATGHYLANVNAGFIVYIVTNPHLKSRGLGSKTLKKMEELFIEDAKLAGNTTLSEIYLETEKEEMLHTEQEKADSLRRNAFFNRNGYLLCEDVTYYQPPLNGEDQIIPLNLFVRNISPSEQGMDSVIKAIYQEKYLSVNQIDERLLNKCLVMMGIAGDLR
ncbi:GNAT family N-acetyltransferase [Sutcliffiella rhizosphaerae]|uniref:N-acetyltransferase domain-containing protein n=1 Tax=Sutcliffiella rhizosphaerae TaxID=2880967 RepID=A0ABM8YP19_9BACI|nr:GNAT family N-acetyltransferase [Sutcliffiella rhizosphaerae]CAG9621550.1 hypothetical protein BACCIP111883_02323 [Sutcliffiella rhizosphaerae]